LRMDRRSPRSRIARGPSRNTARRGRSRGRSRGQSQSQSMSSSVVGRSPSPSPPHLAVRSFSRIEQRRCRERAVNVSRLRLPIAMLEDRSFGPVVVMNRGAPAIDPIGASRQTVARRHSAEWGGGNRVQQVVTSWGASGAALRRFDSEHAGERAHARIPFFCPPTLRFDAIATVRSEDVLR
jgi:hypothetical protein